MYAFHTFLHFIGIRSIKDTQCGFKLFTRRTCAKIFPSMHVERWAFDVECLYLAEQQSIPMIEVPVTWHEVRPVCPLRRVSSQQAVFSRFFCRSLADTSAVRFLIELLIVLLLHVRYLIFRSLDQNCCLEEIVY
jgi:hypothetical protein